MGPRHGARRRVTHQRHKRRETTLTKASHRHHWDPPRTRMDARDWVRLFSSVVGAVLRWGPRGPEFESRRPDSRNACKADLSAAGVPLCRGTLPLVRVIGLWH
jgi:hypothetical protein